MKSSKQILATLVALCVLAVSAFAFDPQGKDDPKLPPKDKQEVPKKDKPPPPPEENKKQGGDEKKKGKP